MKLINPSFEILDKINGNQILKNIEIVGRTCYKSEEKITNDSAEKFVKMVINRGHESVIEHEKATVKIICDRGVSHEIVRHRIASYSQESTRYCNYSKNKFNNELTFIVPCWIDTDKEYECGESNTDFIWFDHMQQCEEAYNNLIELGWSPQQARSVLPNSLKTEIVCTYNLREWRHFFRLRTSKAAHPQMREIACPLLDEFKKLIPVIFDDINYEG